MNKDPQKATKWKGRILIGVEHYETEGPQLGVEPMSRLLPKDEDGNEIEHCACESHVNQCPEAETICAL